MKYIFLVTLLLTQVTIGQDLYYFHSIKKQHQFQYLIQHLRCVVCQDESLADSNASMASDLRRLIYSQVKSNHSNAEIIDFLVKRYGNFVLLKPPFITETYLLWLLPALFVLVGAWMVIKTVYA